jgi:penicillin-binding protein 1A
VKLSLQAGRENVLADLEKIGIRHLKKTCSLALGDNGMTPLEHVGGYAVFASGGMEVRPYAIEEIRTIPGELLYNHDRDEPPRKRIFEQKAVEQLNSMLRSVVTDGTGRRSQLDYTNNAGKTGTSSAYRDAWFMGYTGQYVTGVWLGNDDFTPMARVTGGSFPAEAWKTYMEAAHDTDNIPVIPGVEPHPRQVAEQQRIAAIMSQSSTAELPVPPPAENVKDMPTATRQVLQEIGKLLKKAPRLKTADETSQRRAKAPSAASSEPNLASAADTDPKPRPEPVPAATEDTASAGRAASTIPQ